jgi:hypothetical protein
VTHPCPNPSALVAPDTSVSRVCAAKKAVTNLLTEGIVKDHEEKSAKLHTQKPKAGETLDSILGVELPRLYEDIIIGSYARFSESETRVVGGEKNPWWDLLQDATADPTRDGGYLFSKISYQVKDPPGWAQHLPFVIR